MFMYIIFDKIIFERNLYNFFNRLICMKVVELVVLGLGSLDGFGIIVD